MENLLQSCPVVLPAQIIDAGEDCPFSMEYTLPDYCSDVAVVLKCMAYPRVQNRQLSGDRLLVDGAATVRVLYADEDRQCVRCVEFPAPFSCSFILGGELDSCAPVCLDLNTKYVNCRALTPRRLEIRGAVTVSASAVGIHHCAVAKPQQDNGLHTRCQQQSYTMPCGTAEKVITISETLEFPDTLPGADMLLGGECKAVVTECKLLSGKAIVKGQIYVHQLYTDDLNTGTTHCLDFILPFSQILDVENCVEGMPYDVNVLLLSDTERCSVGPDGGNTNLEVTAKLLVQLQVYGSQEISLLCDGFHSRYPVTMKTEDVVLYSRLGCSIEQTTLPLKITLPSGSWQEVLDVWVDIGAPTVVCDEQRAMLTDRLLVCMLLRDGDGQVVYFEHPEEYRLEFLGKGNSGSAQVTVTEMRYRVCDGCLELQAGLHVNLQRVVCQKHTVLTEVSPCVDKCFAARRATLLMYYAQPGEDAWSIGKDCHTSPHRIQEENEMGEESLCDPCVLTIPIVS